MIFKRVVILFTIGVFTACNNPNVFGKRTLHETYSDKIKSAGLAETALGKVWLHEAERAIKQPQMVTTPYREKGYFLAEKPRAYGLKFPVKRGNRLQFAIDKNPLNDFDLFVDIWKSNDYELKHIKSVDSIQTKFYIDVEEDGAFIIRLQPELLRSGNYRLSISVGPSLASPVAGNKGRIASIWGDSRDGGARSHEGVDLFAPFRTPAVAAADGFITRVNENRLGGKVVWLRPNGKNLSLYYAHLDEQLVNEGDRVKVGDTVGLIGNSGNARTTPPHLHFGIYASGGAIDPFPFINQNIKQPSNLKNENYGQVLRTKRSIAIKRSSQSIEIDKGTPVQHLAYSANEVRVETPLGQIVTIPANAIEEATALNKVVSSKINYLLSDPSGKALQIGTVSPSDTFHVYGHYKQFAFVGKDDVMGWLSSSEF